MKNKTMTATAILVEEQWGKRKSEEIIAAATIRWKELCEENKNACKEKQIHYVENIFPCISYYEALQKNGISKEEALTFMDESWSRQAQKSADSMKKMLRFLGLYKLYPSIFRWVAKQQFGTKAGFEADFYQTDRRCCKFDMKKCLFLDTCKKYGCPELTQCFCHTDDIKNVGLHPKLCWNRTQFMGNGGKFCDFEVYVKNQHK